MPFLFCRCRACFNAALFWNRTHQVPGYHRIFKQAERRHFSLNGLQFTVYDAKMWSTTFSEGLISLILKLRYQTSEP